MNVEVFAEDKRIYFLESCAQLGGAWTRGEAREGAGLVPQIIYADRPDQHHFFRLVWDE